MSKYTIAKVVSIAGIVICAITFCIIGCSWMIILIASSLCALFVILNIIGAFAIQLNYYQKSINNRPGATGQIGITFDDGPDPEITPQILRILKDYQACATFFCIGIKAIKYPYLIKQIIAEGHMIGVHSHTHSPYWGFFPYSAIKKELQLSVTALEDISWEKCRFFRPPYGVTNPIIAKATRCLGLSTIGWNKRSLDTILTDPKKILQRITTNLKEGDIILLHDTQKINLVVLPALLKKMNEAGLTAVTIQTLIKDGL